MKNNLKSIRRSGELAIWGLAARSGVSPSLVTAIEKWDYVPSTGTQERLAQALGVSLREIWPDDVPVEVAAKNHKAANEVPLNE